MLKFGHILLSSQFSSQWLHESLASVGPSWRIVSKFYLKVAGLQVLKSFYEVVLKLQIFCAHLPWTSIASRVLSSANYIWDILSHVFALTIVTYALWHISRPWARGIYWHTLKVHNLGARVKVLNLAHQKLMPMEFQRFSDELIIFI